MSVAPSTLDDLTDDIDGNDNTEMEEFWNTVKGNMLYRNDFIYFNMLCILQNSLKKYRGYKQN